MMNKLTKQDFKKIPVFEPKITLKDKLTILKYLNKNFISGTSPVIKEFEELLAVKFNVRKALTVSNGSVALDLAFQLLNLKDKDEVVMPSFTIISCLSAVIRSGAKPVFCDVDKDSWNMTLKNVQKVVTDKTKAILMVHTYGLTAEALEIEKFCKDQNILLIEDTAEAHGQIYKGKPCGSFGEIATLSFYANKHLTTGEGGALLFKDDNYYEKALSMRNLDFDSERRFKHDFLYWNYRLSGIQASLGVSQIKTIEKTVSNKIKQGKYYNELLKNNKFLQLPLENNLGCENNYWVYGLICKEKSRDDLYNHLLKFGIETRRFFWPLHLQNALPKIYRTDTPLPISEELGRSGLYIPLGNHINKNTQEFISEKINKFFD